LDGKGKRPSSAASPDGEGNDLAAGKAGDVPLAAPQEAHERGAASPAFTLDGKGTDRSPDTAAEVPAAAPESRYEVRLSAARLKRVCRPWKGRPMRIPIKKEISRSSLYRIGAAMPSRRLRV